MSGLKASDEAIRIEIGGGASLEIFASQDGAGAIVSIYGRPVQNLVIVPRSGNSVELRPSRVAHDPGEYPAPSGAPAGKGDEG